MSTNDRAEEILDEREKQRDFKQSQNALQQAFNAQGDLSRDWMREILDTDELEERLQPNTVKKIQALLNKQLILGNLSDAETHDAKYWLEVQEIKILGSHPPPESKITGKTRAFLYDDPEEELYPLTPIERNQIDQIIKSLQHMITRSRGGFERTQINTSIARTENARSNEDNDDGRLTGLFG
jgi:hypothetical protein